MEILPTASGGMLKHVGFGVRDRAKTLNGLELIEQLLLLDRAAIRIDLRKSRRCCRRDDHEQQPEYRGDGTHPREKPRHARSPLEVPFRCWPVLLLAGDAPARRRHHSRCNRFAIGRLPAPGARTIAAPRYPLLVDLSDHLAVAGKERFGRAHFRA